VDANVPGMREPGRRDQVFHHHRGWFAFCAGLVVLAVLGVPVFMRDPEYREAVVSGNPLTSLKFVVATAFNVLLWIVTVPVTVRMWRSSWTFEITVDRLIATHQFTRRRHEIPWGSIAAVSRARPSRLVKSAPRQFSRIELTDGKELLFNPYLSRYTDFVEELRARVTCRVFDPYPPWLGR
jgi:hypothetical protein